MTRRGFGVIVATGVAGAASGGVAEPRPEYWRLPKVIPLDEFTRIARSITKDEWILPRLLNHKQWENKASVTSGHDGLKLEGVWAGLNFPRQVLLEHIEEWEWRLNFHEAIDEIMSWWRLPRSVSDTYGHGVDDLNYGLWMSVYGVLRQQPREFRMQAAEVRSRRMGEADLNARVQGWLDHSRECSRKYGDKTETREWIMAKCLWED